MVPVDTATCFEVQAQTRKRLCNVPRVPPEQKQEKMGKGPEQKQRKRKRKGKDGKRGSYYLI